MKITIRLATSTDTSSLVALLEELYNAAEFHSDIPFDVVSATHFVQRLLLDENSEMLVASLGEELIGCASFTCVSPYYNEHKKIAYGINFYVKPEYRSKGIGRSLYNSVWRLAKGRGCGSAIVGVVPSNKQLINYHKLNGFDDYEVSLIKRL